MISRENSVAQVETPIHVTAQTGVGIPAPDLSDDELLEQGIDHAYSKLVAAATREDREHWCRAMYRLIRSRSQEQIAKLEEQRGLTK